MNFGGFKRLISKGVFPHQWSFILLLRIRSIFLSPKKLTERLEINNTSRVLEVGCGPGFFSVEVARKVTNGQLILADIQPEMLDIAKKRLKRKGLSNVDFYLCSGDTFSFSDNSFDAIFLVTVIGEVESKEAYIREFYRMLKPTGVLSFSELIMDPDRMTMEEITTLVSKHNFRLHKTYGSRRNFTINFTK